jgi:LmbE family N-acetylglucosaminyl deacetylase
MNVLVIAAHPDDEVLGVGGTLALHALQGDKVFPVIVADGQQVRYDEERRAELKEACRKCCATLGTEEPEFLGLPDQHLDTFSQIDLNQALEERMQRCKPQVVYSHHFGDMNRDHQILYDATSVVCRPKPGAVVKRVLAFAVPSSSDWAPQVPGRNFVPNWFVDISSTLERKLAALEHYKSETPPFPHPRSLSAIETQARFWGSSVGVEAAEPFMLMRNLVAR